MGSGINEVLGKQWERFETEVLSITDMKPKSYHSSKTTIEKLKKKKKKLRGLSDLKFFKKF